MTHPADLSLAEAGAALRSGALTATTLVRAHLDRIAERDPAIGAFVHLAPDDALAAASRADANLAAGHDRGPLHGIPFAVKDIIDVEGWPVRRGSALHADRIVPATAACVARLTRAGAIPLGLVATYELATVGPDATSLYRQPRNPWNRAHVTGGSSSGSAAAIAGGLVRIALGTDTGGSIRSPSAYCGIVGLKPTHGTPPMHGVMPLAPSLDALGPMGRCVADVATLFAALSGRPLPPQTGPLRIGYARDWCADPAAHPDLQRRMDDAASALTLAGARVTLVTLPDYHALEAAAATILHAEEAVTQADALADAGRSTGTMAHRSLASGRDVAPDALAAARRAAAEARTDVDAALAPVDALILPTTMAPAPSFAAFDGPDPIWTAMRTIPFNLTGHPALSVPMGLADGLPLGLQIVARPGAEATLLAAAAVFEAATDHAATAPHWA